MRFSGDAITHVQFNGNVIQAIEIRDDIWNQWQYGRQLEYNRDLADVFDKLAETRKKLADAEENNRNLRADLDALKRRGIMRFKRRT